MLADKETPGGESKDICGAESDVPQTPEQLTPSDTETSAGAVALPDSEEEPVAGPSSEMPTPPPFPLTSPAVKRRRFTVGNYYSFSLIEDLTTRRVLKTALRYMADLGRSKAGVTHETSRVFRATYRGVQLRILVQTDDRALPWPSDDAMTRAGKRLEASVLKMVEAVEAQFPEASRATQTFCVGSKATAETGQVAFTITASQDVTSPEGAEASQDPIKSTAEGDQPPVS